jgi:hypothetical protein
VTCQSGLTNCSGTCSNLLSDSGHCGACNIACAAGQACYQGTCASVCTPPLIWCGADGCVDPTKSDKHCGASGTCTGAAAGATCGSGASPVGQFCRGSACTCPPDKTQTCTAAGVTTCVNRTVDPNNCGTCGTKCTTGQRCVSGACRAACSGATRFTFDSSRLLSPGGGSGPAWISLGDLDNDGKLDAAYSDWTGASATLSNAFGNGDGTFVTPVSSLVVTPKVYRTLIADVDGDHNQDILVTTYTDSGGGTLVLRRGSGTRTLQPIVTIPIGFGVMGVAVADVTGDGRPDIVVAAARIWILENQGDGSFAPLLPMHPGIAPSEVKIADLNGDGILDIVSAGVTTDGSAGAMSVMLGLGSGVFSAPQPAYALSAGSNSSVSAVVADLNKDGKPDIVTGDFTSGKISVFINQGNGTFASGVVYTVDGNVSPPAFLEVYAVAAGDFDGDGNVDIVATNDGGGADSILALFPGVGNGTLGAAIPLTMATGFVAPKTVAVGDMNGDGRQDIVVTSVNSGAINVLLNTCQ